jgi:hypothetical protein
MNLPQYADVFGRRVDSGQIRKSLRLGSLRLHRRAGRWSARSPRPLLVKSAVLTVHRPLPVFPNKRIFSGSVQHVSNVPTAAIRADENR